MLISLSILFIRLNVVCLTFEVLFAKILDFFNILGVQWFQLKVCG